MPFHISHNLSIALWFLAYVGLIFLFAAFYFRLYREDPTRFAFAADVRNAQRESFQKRTNDQLGNQNDHLEVAATFFTSIDWSLAMGVVTILSPARCDRAFLR